MSRINLENASSIGDQAFYGCTGLKEVTIGNILEEVGDYAFYKSNSIETLNYNAINFENADGNLSFPNISTLYIGNEVEYIPNLFPYNGVGYKITTLVIPNRVTTIASNAFYYCSNIKSLSLGNSLSKISYPVFTLGSLQDLTVGNDYGLNYVLNAKQLTKIVIAEDFSGSTLSGNFSSQNLLEAIECKNVVPLTFSESAPFTEEQYSSIKVTVPEEAKETYKNAPVWKLFFATDGIRFATVYNGNSAGIPVELNGTEIPEEATAANALVFVDEELDEEEVPANMVYKKNGEWHAKEIVLKDGNPFYCPVNVTVDVLTFTRKFGSAQYYAIFYPFMFRLNDICDYADIYRLNTYYQSDTDGDGEIDKKFLNILKVYENQGNLKPNHPYIIAPKQSGSLVLTVQNTYLAESKIEPVECSTLDTRFSFVGLFQTRNNLYSDNAFFLDGGLMCYAPDDNFTLGAFRWIMKIQNKDSQFETATRAIPIEIVRDDEDPGFDNNQEENLESHTIYSLDGRIVDPNNLSTGLYVKNGKKFLYKH